MLEPALLIRSCTEWLISPIWVLFLGQIVVSHVQSIAKLSLNVSKSQISTFFTPIQSYFLFGRKCPPLSLSLSRVYRKEKTHRSYAANRWLVMNDLFLNLFFTPTLFSPPSALAGRFDWNQMEAFCVARSHLFAHPFPSDRGGPDPV